MSGFEYGIADFEFIAAGAGMASFSFAGPLRNMGYAGAMSSA